MASDELTATEYERAMAYVLTAGDLKGDMLCVPCDVNAVYGGPDAPLPPIGHKVVSTNDLLLRAARERVELNGVMSDLRLRERISENEVRIWRLRCDWMRGECYAAIRKVSGWLTKRQRRKARKLKRMAEYFGVGRKVVGRGGVSDKTNGCIVC